MTVIRWLGAVSLEFRTNGRSVRHAQDYKFEAAVDGRQHNFSGRPYLALLRASTWVVLLSLLSTKTLVTAESEAMTLGQVTVPERCVFILATGRSGSTSLVDAVNQLPNYLIRGEQAGAFWYLYQTFRMLQSAMSLSEFHPHRQQADAQSTYDTVKRAYDTLAVQTKLPWFNDLNPVRLAEAARAFFSVVYGYHGPGSVSGFKEIRFVCGRAFREPCDYDEFVNFLEFLKMMCTNVKVLLNSRASHSSDDNTKLVQMMKESGILNSTAKLDKELEVTHSWFDRYTEENPAMAFRVRMEDMFNPQLNGTLARQLVHFLGEDPDAHRISFTRMPTWSTSVISQAARSPRKPSHGRDPWWLRRRRRTLAAVAGSGSAGKELGAGSQQR